MEKVKGEVFVEKYMGTFFYIPLYQIADCSSPDYDGGRWEFVGNGEIGYGYPTGESTYHCVNPAAFYECDASGEVLGIVVMLYYLNQSLWAYYEKGDHKKARWFHDKFYALRDWAYENLSEEDASKVHWLLD